MQKLIQFASDYLNDDTGYSSNKGAIQHLFSTEFTDTWKGAYRQLVFLRLSVIDGAYSTNTDKIPYSLADLVDALAKNGNKPDVADRLLREELTDFVQNPGTEHERIVSLFNDHYGISSQKQNFGGEQGGKRISLLSKYAYFLCNKQFPIYDNLVKEELENHYWDELSGSISFDEKIYKNSSKYPELSSRTIIGYIRMINRLKQRWGAENYDVLDNFFWLCGKVRNGSYSLILPKKHYEYCLKENNWDRFFPPEKMELWLHSDAFPSLGNKEKLLNVITWLNQTT